MKFTTFAVGPKAKHNRPVVRMFHKGLLLGVLAMASASSLSTLSASSEEITPAQTMGQTSVVLDQASQRVFSTLSSTSSSGVSSSENLGSRKDQPNSKVLIKSLRFASEQAPNTSYSNSVEFESDAPPFNQEQASASEKITSEKKTSLFSRSMPSLSNAQSLVNFTSQSYANLAPQSQAPRVVLPLNEQMLSDLEEVNGLPRLAQQWLDANIKPEYINNLLNVWVWAQSPVVCANQACEEITQRLSEMSKQLRTIDSNAQALAFLNQNNISDFNEQLLLQGETLDINHLPISAEGKVMRYPRGWNKSNPRAGLVKQWQRLSMYTNIEQNPHLTHHQHQFMQLKAQGQHDQALAKAYDLLEEVVSETGLSSIKVPLPMSHQPALVSQLAQDLRQANRDLQHITGWSGSVLGLNGRVDLVPMRPDDMASTSMSLLGGSIVVRTDWETFAHEWFHALDVSLMLDNVGMDQSRFEYNLMLEGTKAIYTPDRLAWPVVGQTLSSYVSQAPLASNHPHEDVLSTWKGLHPLLRQVSMESQPKGKSWMMQLEQKIQEYQNGERYSTFRGDEAEYRSKHSEKLAYAFGAYATLQSGLFRELSVLTDGIRAPFLEEARHYDTVFKPALAQIGQSWWKSQKPVLAYYAIPNATRVAFDASPSPVNTTPIRHMVASQQITTTVLAPTFTSSPSVLDTHRLFTDPLDNTMHPESIQPDSIQPDSIQPDSIQQVSAQDLFKKRDHQGTESTITDPQKDPFMAVRTTRK